VTEPQFETYFSLRKRGAFREAYSELQAIMEKRPRWSKQGDLYVWCAEFELLLNGDMGKAQEYLDTALKLGCVHLSAYHSIRGAVLCQIGDRREGIAELRRSIALDPSDWNVATLMIASEEGDWPECVQTCQEILRQDPHHCMAHVCLAWDANHKGDRDKAMLLAKDAGRFAHSALELHKVACLYHALGELQSAIEAYLEADRLGYEEKGVTYAAVATCYFQRKDYPTGNKYLAIAIEHSPEDEYVRSVKALAESEEGDRGHIPG
jgi:tetratricopeptide (TPR) repeat protein